MEGDGADGFAISPVDVAGASSAWCRGGRDASSVRAVLGKRRRCGRWHRVRVLKQDVRGGDGGASRRSSAPSVASVVGGVCGGAVNHVLRAVAPPPLCSTVRRGPTNHGSVGRPRPGREIEPDSAFGLGRCGDRTNNVVRQWNGPMAHYLRPIQGKSGSECI
jgi:hypothetical protein